MTQNITLQCTEVRVDIEIYIMQGMSVAQWQWKRIKTNCYHDQPP